MNDDWVKVAINVIELIAAYLTGGLTGLALYHFYLRRAKTKVLRSDVPTMVGISQTAERVIDVKTPPLGNRGEMDEENPPYRWEMLNPFVVSLAAVFILLSRVLFDIDLVVFLIILALFFFSVLALTWYKNR